jgi:hypothetical protein
MLQEIVTHAFEDSINILPFLFLTYYAVEYIQHKTGFQNKVSLQKFSKYGPVIGSILGIFPQCGFASVASGLYAGKVITPGTLISVYLATSDEMLPIMIAKGIAPKLIVKILCLKILVGFLGGTLTDWIFRKRTDNKRRQEIEGDFEFRVYNNTNQASCFCSSKGGILYGAFRHSLATFFFIFLVTVMLTFVTHEFGKELIAGFVLNRPLIGETLGGLIGMIPNCAASVVLTEFYLEGGITFSAMMSGLFTGCGVGILVLFRERRKYWKENLKIVGLLYGIGVFAGWIILAANI